MSPHRSPGLAAALGLVLLCSAPSAHAASCAVTYSGPVNGAWNVAANWGGSLPTSAQDACIPAGKGTVEIPAGTTANALTLAAQSAVHIAGTANLSLADAGVAHASTFGDVTDDGALNSAGAKIRVSGTFALNGKITGATATTDLLSGTLTGSGTIGGGLFNEGATIKPGGDGAVGTLAVAGAFSQLDGATIDIEIASPASFDSVSTGSDAFFAGTVKITELGAYKPPLNSTWAFVESSAGADNFGPSHADPSAFKVINPPKEIAVVLDSPLSDPAPPPQPAPPADPPSTPPSSAATSSASATAMTAGTASLAVPPASIASAGSDVSRVLLGCSGRSLVLNDVVQRAGRVALDGAADPGLAGQAVTILFDGRQKVATTTVGPDGHFATTAPLPPKRLRASNSARYTAVSSGRRSLDLKLARRLVLDPIAHAGGTVTLTGRIVGPLAEPAAPVTVSEQVACGSTKVVATFKPGPGGRFRLTIPAPGGAAAIYRLQTKVREAPRSRRTAATFSLPLPVALT